jgi:SAM-dependent methyltransferase
MLAEHLSQEHEAASRPAPVIDGHVAWLHELVGERPTRVLDLGCGPGLYAERLARLGHECVGFDIAPAAVRYAEARAEEGSLACTYHLADLRVADFGSGFGLVLLLFGDLDTFPPDEIAGVLNRAAAALGDGGVLVVEGHRPDTVEEYGRSASSWYRSSGGLFSPGPHIVLEEHSWHEEARVAVTRFWVLEAGGAAMHSVTTAARDHAALLEAVGLEVQVIHPPGEPPWVDERFRVLAAGRAG